MDVHVGREYDPFARSRSPIEPFAERRWSPFATVDRLFGSFESFGGTGFLRADRLHAYDAADYDVYLSREEAATGVTATIDVGFGPDRVAIPPGITDGVRLSALVRQERGRQRVTFDVHVAGG